MLDTTVASSVCCRAQTVTTIWAKTCSLINIAHAILQDTSLYLLRTRDRTVAKKDPVTKLIFSPRLDLSALLMLPVSPYSLALRVIIGLIDPLSLAFLFVGCLPLPFSLRRMTARTFSGYRTVLGTTDPCILSW